MKAVPIRPGYIYQVTDNRTGATFDVLAKNSSEAIARYVSAAYLTD